MTAEGALHTAPSAPARRPDGPGVTFVIDSLGWGGAERLMLEFLPRLAMRGIAVDVVVLADHAGNPLAAELLERGVPVQPIPVRALRQPSAVPRLVAHLRAVRPALVHTQFQAADVLGTIAARIAGIPALSSQHMVERSPRLSRGGLREFAGSRVISLGARRIIVVSDAARDFCRRELRLPERKLVRLYNGIDVDRFARRREPRQRLRAEFAVAADERLVASVAVLRPEKGIADALRAIAALDPELRVRYLVIGDGPDRARLEGLSEALAITDRVTFTGARFDVAELLSACDLLLHPSHRDALPTVLAEAMAASLPIVATRVGGIPEMLADGETGLLVPPEQPAALSAACSALVGAPARMQAMGGAGRARAERMFSLDAYVDRLIAIYAGLSPALAGR